MLPPPDQHVHFSVLKNFDCVVFIADQQIIVHSAGNSYTMVLMTAFSAAEIQAKVDKGVASAQKEDLPAPKRTRKAIADVEVDVQSLMKERRAVAIVKKEGDHSHAGRSALETWEVMFVAIFF